MRKPERIKKKVTPRFPLVKRNCISGLMNNGTAEAM
jgi:hypothetical protein